MNALQVPDINEFIGENHEICHDIFMKARTNALEFKPTGCLIDIVMYGSASTFLRVV